MDVRSTISLAGGLLVLGFVGYWWGGFGKQDEVLAPRSTVNLPDYEITGVNALRTDEDGQISQTLVAQRIVHFPNPDRSEVERPRILLFRDGQPRWEVTAEGARGQDARRDLTLYGDVTGRSLSGTPLTLKTDTIQANQDSRVLSTSAQVRITSPQGEISSLGLSANIAEGALEFPAQVRGTYVIPHAR